MATGHSSDPSILEFWSGPFDRRLCSDRRHSFRFGWDRRGGNRRKQQLRSVTLAIVTLVIPAQIVKLHPLVTSGSTAVIAVAPVPPDRAYDSLIAEAAARYNLDAALIKAIIRTESSFIPSAVSPVGAQGLMQLMPALAEEMGVLDPFDPRENIMAGAKYLRQLLDATRGSVPLALASYNAGPANVARYRGIPPFEETRAYVRKITALLAVERSAANQP